MVSLKGVLNRSFFLNRKRNYIILTQILTAFIGLFFGKLIAVYVEPSEYGLYSLQFGVFTLVFSFFFNPFIQFYKSSINNLYAKIGFEYFRISFAILSGIVSSIILLYLFSIKSYSPSPLLIFIILAMVPLNVYFQINNDYNNVIDNYRKFCLSNIIRAITPMLMLIVLFVLYKVRIPERDVIWLVNLTGLFFGLVFAYNKGALKIRSRKILYSRFLKANYKFGMPLALMAVLSWVNSFLDRYIIEYFLDLKQVGIYNANYSLGSKFFLLLSPIFLILLTPLVFDKSTIKTKKTHINKYMKAYLIIGVFIIMGVFLTSNFIGSLLLSHAYSSGFNIIFLISISYFFLVGITLLETIFYAEKNTKVILYGVVISAGINLLLNLVFIPYFGILGAAFSSILSYFARFFYVYFNYRKL